MTLDLALFSFFNTCIFSLPATNSVPVIYCCVTYCSKTLPYNKPSEDCGRVACFCSMWYQLMWLDLRINFQGNFFTPISDALVSLFLSFILPLSSNDALFPSVFRMAWAPHNMVVSGYLHILQWFLTYEEQGIEAARPVKLSSSTSA